MERVAIDLGIIQIYWYSIFILLGILAACITIYIESKRKNIDTNFILDTAFSATIMGILGARIYYVAFNWGYYQNNLLEILEIWNGGLAIHGGIIFGFINVLVKCNRGGYSVLKILDIAVVGLIIGQAIGRWGNFFNSEAYGAVTTLEYLQSLHIPQSIINGMYILGEYRMPTFLFESVFNLIGFIILVLFRRIKFVKVGQVTAIYLMWYSAVRYVIEGSRADSLMLGNMKIAQLVSIILFIIGVFVLIYSFIRKTDSFEDLYNKEDRQNGFIDPRAIATDDNKQVFIK